MKPITLKIDVTKIDKSLLFTGQKGTYLDIVLFENTKPSQYGDTHFCVQGVWKEERERGVRGPIIGNATVPAEEHAQRRQSVRPPPPPRSPSPPPPKQRDPDLDQPEDDSIPF